MQELTKKRTGKIMIVLLSLIVALTFTIAMTDNADAAAAKKFTIKYGSKKIVVQTVKKGKAKLTTYKALQDIRTLTCMIQKGIGTRKKDLMSKFVITSKGNVLVHTILRSKQRRQKYSVSK